MPACLVTPPLRNEARGQVRHWVKAPIAVLCEIGKEGGDPTSGVRRKGTGYINDDAATSREAVEVNTFPDVNRWSRRGSFYWRHVVRGCCFVLFPCLPIRKILSKEL